MITINLFNNIENLNSKFTINNTPNAFHFWIKRSCFQYDCDTYTIYLNDLQYLYTLLCESKFRKTNNLNNGNEDRRKRIKLEENLKKSISFNQDIQLYENYERVDSLTTDFLNELKKSQHSFIYSIQKMEKLILSIIKYGIKYKTDVLYYKLKFRD
jgi:hypothetical protein